MIQGYTGEAAIDAQHQIIVKAQAHGAASEQELLLPMVAGTKEFFAEHSVITTDAGYHSEATLQQLAARQVTAFIADNDMHRRDERFATQGRHQAASDPLYNRFRVDASQSAFQPSDFIYDAEARTCVCPAGNALYRKGRSLMTRGYVSEQFRGAKRDCVPCALRTKCFRTPDHMTARQAAFFRSRVGSALETHIARMKQRIDSQAGRARYAQRFATVEPIFANGRYTKGLDRSTLHGWTKVDRQRKLCCLVHDIEKLAKPGTQRKATPSGSTSRRYRRVFHRRIHSIGSRASEATLYRLPVHDEIRLFLQPQRLR